MSATATNDSTTHHFAAASQRMLPQQSIATRYLGDDGTVRSMDTFAGPVAVDEQTKLALGHILVDGSQHPFFGTHVRAVIADCGSVACGHQLQRFIEVLHVQAKNWAWLIMLEKSSVYCESRGVLSKRGNLLGMYTDLL